MTRLSGPRVLAITAIIAGIGLLAWPQSYTNSAYRVLFSIITAREAGIAWIIIGALALAMRRRWTIALLGAAILGWGLGFASAALTDHSGHLTVARSGSPLGWVWFVGVGLAVLITLARSEPETRA